MSLLNSTPELINRYSRDMVYQGSPETVHEASDWRTVAEILAQANADKTPVTFCGSQTSMTGASVADSGIAIALRQRDKILDIKKEKSGGGMVITEPGVILGDLKRLVADEGLFYPPDPTSQNECQIGANVATNATGEDTFRYGPTRWYVEELEVLDATGNQRILTRTKPFPHTEIKKNFAGYFLDGEEIDELVGSEGTLALITKIRLKLLPAPGKGVFIIVLPFSDFKKCLAAVPKIAASPLAPQALELIGPGAGDYFRRAPSCPEELKSENIFLYIKESYLNPAGRDRKIEQWYRFLKKLYSDLNDTASLDRVFTAQNTAQLNAIRDSRHYLPLKVNEEYFSFRQQGGGKVGSDWWVPLHHLDEMMLSTYDEALKLEIPFLVFAHIGNGHPHWNFLTKNPEEKKRAHDFLLRQCKMAALLGGGVAGEHGIGKIKRDLLAIQHSPKTIARMRQLKLKWDPNWILGRGNILFPA